MIRFMTRPCFRVAALMRVLQRVAHAVLRITTARRGDSLRAVMLKSTKIGARRRQKSIFCAATAPMRGSRGHIAA